MFGPRWMKNISNIRFLTTPLNWFRGFLLYTFIWHSYWEGATPQVYPTEKMCYFHLDSFCDPQIHEQTAPTRVEVHPSVLTFLPNQKPHNQSVQQFTNQKRPLPPPTSPPGQAMAAHFVSAHASISTSQTTSCGPRFHDWRGRTWGVDPSLEKGASLFSPSWKTSRNVRDDKLVDHV